MTEKRKKDIKRYGIVTTEAGAVGALALGLPQLEQLAGNESSLLVILGYGAYLAYNKIMARIRALELAQARQATITKTTPYKELHK